MASSGGTINWINAGDDASWMNGGVPVRDGPNLGSSTAAGAQCLPGFQPASEQDETRTNVGFYVDLENNIPASFSLVLPVDLKTTATLVLH